MKKTTVIHGTWCAVAMATFGMGHYFSNRSGGALPAQSADSRTLFSTRVMQSGGGIAAGGGKVEEGGSGAARPASGATSAFAAGPLLDNEIEAVAKDAFTDPNPLKRQLAFARLLEGLTPENAELIREQMRGGRANGDQWRLFQYAWGAADGEGALAAAEAIENKDYRNGAISQALSGWASADPRKAIAWLDAMDDGDEKKRLQDSLVGGLADHDIGTATDYVLNLAKGGDERASSYMENVASEQIRKEGHQAAALWAERLPDGNVKGAALDRVANTFVARDPAAAAAWATQFATEEYGARVIEEVGDEWAERDPVASVAWLESLDESRGKTEGMSSALGEWARRDPTAASEYLVNMPASDLKDTAVSGFVQRVAWEDPESAIVWADSIAQPEVRTEAMTRAAQAYFIRDREAAIEWLPESGLPPEAQKRVLETRRDRDRRGRG